MFLWRSLRPDAVMVLLQLLVRGDRHGGSAVRAAATGSRPAGNPAGEAPSDRKA